MTKRFIYFVGVEGRPHGPIKIGSTLDVQARFHILKCGSPDDLRLIGFTEGSHKDEALIHRAFSGQHLHSEWFAHTDALERAIDWVLRRGFEVARQSLEELAKDGRGIRVKSEEGLERIRAGRRAPETAEKVRAFMASRANETGR